MLRQELVTNTDTNTSTVVIGYEKKLLIALKNYIIIIYTRRL